MRRLIAIAGCLAAVTPAPATADTKVFASPIVADSELGTVTGKFILPNGAELALSIVSDTVVNGLLVLRTVLRVDTGSSVQVFGRTNSADGTPYPVATASAAASSTAPSGIEVELDRRSGITTVTPMFNVVSASAVQVKQGAAEDPASWGVSQVSVVPGGPAVETAAGAITIVPLSNGTLVTLNGDQFQASHLVGQSIASAITNSANDRTIDTVTNINIDLRDISPFVADSAALRVDSLATDISRALVR